MKVRLTENPDKEDEWNFIVYSCYCDENHNMIVTDTIQGAIDKYVPL